MIQILKSKDRGHTNMGWLDSNHSFSFGEYYNPDCMGFRSLRVINDDRVAGGGGFGSHPHREMEIVSYVVDGGLAHKDSTGTQSTIEAGHVQRMTAGTGVTHSEFNASQDSSVHFLQIWIEPAESNLPPGYEEKHFDSASKTNRLCLIGSPDGRDGSLTVHQDVDIYASLLAHDESIRLDLRPERAVWVQLVRGEIEVNGQPMSTGDGMTLEGERALSIQGRGADAAEFLVFDLA